MKKLIALLLVAAIGAALVACGGKETDKNNDSAVVGEQISGAETEKKTETTPATQPENTESMEAEAVPEAEITFDTSWAGADYEMPIPEPPFAYEIDESSSGVKISSTNGGEDGDVTHNSILEYCDFLKEVGFDMDVRENVIGERYGRTCYEFSAKNEAGNYVELIDDGGCVVIFVYFD